jgi:aspartyl-tRNA(Asn)/glutamyl-tRNA(Gln) amidotransferase subunit C
MSTITEETVQNIARLARLAVKPEEMPVYTKNLSTIFSLVEQMNQVDTTGIKPMAHPSDTSLQLREDEVTEPNERDVMQKLTVTEAGLYLVPQVIE